MTSDRMQRVRALTGHLSLLNGKLSEKCASSRDQVARLRGLLAITDALSTQLKHSPDPDGDLEEAIELQQAQRRPRVLVQP